MPKTETRHYIKIRREEYAQLKHLQKYFEGFWSYVSHLRDIQEARGEVRRGETIPQEEFFRAKGL